MDNPKIGFSTDDDYSLSSKNSEEVKPNARFFGPIQTSSAVTPVTITSDYAKERRRILSPKWLNEAPIWIQAIIVISLMATVFSIVFLIFLISLSASENAKASSTANSVPSPEQGEDTSHESSTGSEENYDFINNFISFEPSEIPSNNMRPSFSPSSPWPSMFPSLSLVPSTEPTTIPSSSPTQNPSDRHSSLPSSLPSSQPIPNPSTTPSIYPTLTRSPTPLPSKEPTPFPSASPTTTPTSTPSKSLYPSASPTSAPSSMPTPPTVTTFFVTASMPNEEDMDKMQLEISSMPSETDFFVHLGDFNQDKECNESSYASFSYFLRNHSNVPVFMVPGDNEWNDCPIPNKAWRYWENWFFDFDKFWSPHHFNVVRRNGREENFAFLHKKVLFVGVRVVGGDEIVKEETTEDEPSYWSQLMKSNIAWLNTQIKMHRDEFELMIIFGHNNRSENDNRDFFVALGDVVKELGITTLYFHETSDGFNVQERNFGSRDLYMVSIQGGSFPLMKVEIDTQNDVPFTFGNE